MRLYLYVCDGCGALNAASDNPESQPGYRCNIVRQYSRFPNEAPDEYDENVTCTGNVKYIGFIDLANDTFTEIVAGLATEHNPLPGIIANELVPRPERE